MAPRKKKQPEIWDESTKSELIRRFKASPFLFIGTIVVLVIVVVAFVFVPAIVPGARGGGDLTFGYYNKVPIKYVRDNYFQQVQQSLAQNQNLSTDDPNYIYKYAQIWRGAFEETAVHLGILDEMKQAGYIIPEDAVDRAMAELPYFQENGRFSSARYRAMDNNSRMNLWRQVRDSVAAGCYLSDLENMRTSSKEASFVSSLASPRRNFDLVAFPISSYPDSEIIAYAEANPLLFRITSLSRITLSSSEREAQQVLDSVKSGVSTFEEAARTNSQDWYAERGGDMGIRMAWELNYEISDEADRERIINLPRGSLSDVIKVSTGWAFFRAEESAHPADSSDPSQMEKIRSYIMENMRGRAEDWLMAEAEKFSAQAEELGFDEAVYAADLNKQSFGPIPVNYGNVGLFSSVASAGVPELSSAGANQFFWRTAFFTPLNTLSRPFVIGDNVIVLLPLEESNAEENDIEFIEMYYPYWMSEGMRFAYRDYFLSSEKLDDRFEETFWRLWGGS